MPRELPETITVRMMTEYVDFCNNQSEVEEDSTFVKPTFRGFYKWVSSRIELYELMEER